jgi:hypothetical protein
MNLTQQQANAVNGAVWLFGLAALFATGFWWPGIMFVIGVSGVVQSMVRGHGLFYGLQTSLWAFGLGIWAIFHYHIAVFFVILGVITLLGAFVKPPFI